MNTYLNPSTIEVVIGNMFSGKSRELLHRGKIVKEYGSVKVFYFKPELDTRDDQYIRSREGNMEKARLFDRSQRIEKCMRGYDPSLVLIDEAQFCDDVITYVAKWLKMFGHNVVLYGLPLDYRGMPFGAMPSLMAIADKLSTLHSICRKDKCHNDATLPQRLRNGEPEDAFATTVIIEGADDIIYEPRCNEHHKVPNLADWTRQKIKKGW